MIDSGFVVAAFVPLVLLWICGQDHLTPVWRITLGIGAIPPCSLLIMRFYFTENPQFKKYNMKHVRMPYWLIIKYYFPRLVVVSLIWFIYDFSSYSFGIFSSQILSIIIPEGSDDLYKTFGWNVVFNLFYIPGSFVGAFVSDYIGPRLTLAIGVGLQGIIGFCMAGKFESLSANVAAFTVVFGIFTTLGEFGPGDNIGLIASKTSATAIRGQYYGIAAAVGKIGAFVGTYIFPIIIARYGGNDTPPRLASYTVPFYISSALCLVSACLALFGLPSLTQDAVNDEDIKFRNYLLNHGFDISKMGDVEYIDSEDQYVDQTGSLAVSEERKYK
jgi:nitrate/nitrite transporter NarK